MFRFSSHDVPGTFKRVDDAQAIPKDAPPWSSAPCLRQAGLMASDLTGMSGCFRLASKTLCARTSFYQGFVRAKVSLDLRSRPTLLVLIAHFAFRLIDRSESLRLL
jgi:hypothetical protein